MSTLWIIAKTSLLESSRKQIFHVLCLIMLAVIAGSTLLSIFTEGTQIKMLKDLCMTCILFGGAVLAIALGATGIPNDVESRTIYPIIARPLTRMQYVIGKYLGTLLTVIMAVLAMSVVFAMLIWFYEKSFDTYLLLAMLFTILEVAIIAAIATMLSTFTSPAVTSVLSFIIYLFGSIKIGYFGGIIERASGGISKFLFSLIYHLLPNLECFNLKTALVHHDAIPASYLIQVALYGIIYTVFLLIASSFLFSRKEV